MSKNKRKKRETDEAKLERKWRKQRAKRGYSDCDAWSIDMWFLEIMPKMLQQMRDNLHGYPDSISSYPGESQAIALNSDDEPEGMRKWKSTLDRMIFLLKEMGEDTCSFHNPYEKRYKKINRKFVKKYGLLGDKLKTKEQKKEEKKAGSYRMMTPRDYPDLYPEYSGLADDYFRCEQNKMYYRDRCREEFFHLFSKHFWSLWD